ncbi:MAG: hypothetical protein CVV64_08760 [Candidatus Wallbacteria bacterium HGW-Wallbacteria-1]|uniref:Uncharacterized protein n=1 Tax=Candidatus Wallbacteria bacterium HGW-Wallbacteria-1 TaxID=2013854 RepID=A0A2N1PQ33_9BACT|nr:MAG: hypothetical protein CVV64_08760 [Candidatus Wallbacteria bacterium HGW-Wallbacteria-1]
MTTGEYGNVKPGYEPSGPQCSSEGFKAMGNQMVSKVVKYSNNGGKGMNMKRFNRAVSMVLVVAFLGMVCVGDVAYAMAPAIPASELVAATVYPVQKNTFDTAVNLNQPGATPNNIGLTPKVQNAGQTVVNKTTGAVQSIGTGVKGWWNKITTPSTTVPTTTTTTPDGGVVISTPNNSGSSASTGAASSAGSSSSASTSTPAASGDNASFWSKLRSSVGQGAHKLGSMIEPANNNNSGNTASGNTVAADQGTTATQTTPAAPSRDAVVQNLVDDGAITVDKNGRAHWSAGSAKKGFVSNADLDNMVTEKSTAIQKQAALESTTTSTGQTSTMTKVEAMDRLGIVKKGNNFYVEKPVAKATVETMIQGKMTEAGCTRADAMNRLGISQDQGGNYKVSRAVKQSTVDQMVNDKMSQSVADQTGAAGDTAAADKPSRLSKFKGDLADGYQSGMTNAKAVTKATLDFRGQAAWQNLAITAGVTVGANIISDIANGRPVDLGKAVGSVARREFAGAYVGGALGCAGGALAQGLLSAVPVVGPIIGAFMPALGGIVGGNLGSSLAGQTRDGKFSLAAAFATIDPVQVTGQAIGSTIGAMLGSLIPIPVVGTMLGGMVGGWLGGKAATFVAGLFGRNKTTTTTTTGGGRTDTTGTTGGTGSTSVDPGSFSAREAQIAYQDYISAYNRLTDLMTAGKGDTPEAQAAYSEYKASKEKYESLTNAMKK